MIRLADVEERLALFVEGIFGRYLHIRSTDAFQLESDASAPSAGQRRDSLLLPDQLPLTHSGAYRVLALQQIGRREFGTHSFRLAELQRALHASGSHIEIGDRNPTAAQPRRSDFAAFFDHFVQRDLIARAFWLLEQVRVDAAIVHAYPGISPHYRRFHEELAPHLQPVTATHAHSVLDLFARWLHAPADTQATLHDLDQTGTLKPVVDQAHILHRPDSTVFDTARCARTAYFALLPSYRPIETVDAADEPTSDDWLQRDAQLEDWADEMRERAAQILAMELSANEQLEAGAADNLTGELRPEDVSIDALKSAQDDQMRRAAMERSAIRHAIGEDTSHRRSYRYDEWDYLDHRYLPSWCRLFEEIAQPSQDIDLAELHAVIRAWREPIKRQLARVRPLGLQRVRRVADGDELDLDAVLQARTDLRASGSADERLYSRRDRMRRDLCVAFLVDLSASTDDPLERPTPPPATDDDDTINLRDPFGPYDAPPPPDEPAPRRIIDVQRDAMVAMAAALADLGDPFGIYGFSGYGRECVDYYVMKDIDDPFNTRTLQRIASMKPRRSTRMGPAIRHTTARLQQTGSALQAIVILSDGFPQDSDYGPERGNHEYGLEDTAVALREAEQKGVRTFCVTVDRSGHDYLRRMCPGARYRVIEEIEDLPVALSTVYEALTG